MIQDIWDGVGQSALKNFLFPSNSTSKYIPRANVPHCHRETGSRKLVEALLVIVRNGTPRVHSWGKSAMNYDVVIP